VSDNALTQRSIPSVDECLKSKNGQALISRVGRELVVETYRTCCAELRRSLNEDPTLQIDSVPQWLEERTAHAIDTLLSASLKPVLNLTGTVLHTNLGRAPMPEESLDAMIAVARGASNLEYNLDKGKRGDRDDHVEAWLCRLTGAEAATVVNNNAAAVLLCLNALASRRSVAVSRGELVEIGGSFRMPDIMKRAGCKLHEVGTTNRTHVKDYIDAVDEGAKCVMRVHTSNFKVAGFTSAVDDKSLGALARERDIPFINDLGAGALIDMTRFGLPAESTPKQALLDGANVVTFSGDKLLGGPQCGLIVGDRNSIARIKRSPLKRALRCDKMTLAALESILRLYANPEKLREKIPSLRLLSRDAEAIRQCAENMQPVLAQHLEGVAKVSIKSCSSQIGSGALPIDLLPSWALVIELESQDKKQAGKAAKSKSSQRNSGGRRLLQLARHFRLLPLPIIGRIHEGALWLDLRCLEDEAVFLQNLQALKINSLV